eukprot:TRINITY_DN35992_c0_g1_i1.p1 TRINITY_DN35992_c0_g1~~TRINITY_DN35992_c0_g1_i1.p1  ORF type:complete len:464 (+),score=39.82 TRINITY_DN35992_c0_g1_i1:130-1521(+)
MNTINKGVLYLYKWGKMRDMIQERVSTYNYPYNYFYVCSMQSPDRTIVDIFNECCVLVEAANVHAVISTDDFGSLIEGALIKKYNHLQGASFESEFLAMHKYYTRAIIGSKVAGANVEFGSWDRVATENTPKTDESEVASWLNIDVNQITGKINLTGIVGIEKVIAKPYLSTCSENIVVLKGREAIGNYLKRETLAESSKHAINNVFKNFLCEHIDMQKYEVKPGVIMEEFLDSTELPLTFHSYDVAIQNKEVIHWVLADNVYWHHRPLCFQALLLPSILPAKPLKMVQELMKHLGQVMGTYGYDNQFLNAEFIVVNGGDTVRMMEINGRMAGQIGSFCAEVLENGDMFKAAIQMAMGIPLTRAQSVPNRYGLNAYLNYFDSGKAGDIIDFEKAKQIPEVRMYFDEDQYFNYTGDPSGRNLGYVNAVGTSYEDCVDRVRNICRQIFKRPQFSPWLEEISEIQC